MTVLTKPIRRKTARAFLHYRKELVVQLLPGDVLSLRLLRERRVVLFDLHGLYLSGLRRDLAAERKAKRNRK